MRVVTCVHEGADTQRKSVGGGGCQGQGQTRETLFNKERRESEMKRKRMEKKERFKERGYSP